jgi:Zn-finger nucleic acid-binding protein
VIVVRCLIAPDACIDRRKGKMKCKKCKVFLKYLGALLGGIQIWGCPKCRRVWWRSPEEPDEIKEME